MMKKECYSKRIYFTRNLIITCQEQVAKKKLLIFPQKLSKHFIYQYMIPTFFLLFKFCNPSHGWSVIPNFSPIRGLIFLLNLENFLQVKFSFYYVFFIENFENYFEMS